MPASSSRFFLLACPTANSQQPSQSLFSNLINKVRNLRNVKHGLELDDERPLLVGDVLAVELLEAVDGGARDLTVQHVGVLELPAVGGLVAAHLDLDGHRGLALLADGDLLVLTLDGCAVWFSVVSLWAQGLQRGSGVTGAEGVDNLLETSRGVSLDGRDGRVDLERTLDDVDTDDDGAGLVEDGDGLEDAGEDGQHLGVLLLLLEQVVHVLGELVEEVVDDVGGEDLDAVLLGVGRRLLLHLDVEAEHDGVVGRLLQHDAALHHVALGDGADAHVGHGDLAVLEEVQQGLEGSQGGRLDGHTTAGPLDSAEQGLEIALELVLDVVLVVVGAGDQQTRTSDGLLETRCDNLDTERGLDLLVVHLLELLWREQGSDVGLDDTFCAAQENPVAFAKDTVGQDNIDGHTETFDLLDFQNGGLALGKVHERAHHPLLGKLHNELEHVWDTLTSVGRCGDQGHVFGHGLVLVEELGVETLLGESDLGLVQTVLELVLHSLALQRQTLLEAVVVNLLPAVKTIDLVEGNDEGSLSVTEQLHRLESLRLKTVHDIDDQNSNVAKRRTSGTQVGERLVTGRVDDQETRDLELKLAILVDDMCLLLDGVDGEVSGTNLLSDTTGLTFLDVGLTDLVEQLRLTSIDVAKNTANGRSEVVL
ncbi:hypothetical protein VMCG_05275 [Cytospora schulzeri]|uniref:NAD-specific glutamate dehydrogenase n=1 Tax=Cytospora schulzeri TaxID=448051 RepID=A0A423WQQ2_9PEZI|nr:hypothetical protein VMCG_05275 [Valsa malicola]